MFCKKLPDTDSIRLRALRIALEESSKVYPHDVVYSPKLYFNLKSFLPMFEQEILLYNDVDNRKLKLNKDMTKHFEISKLYLSHFIQVLTLSILRKEIKPEFVLAYGIGVDDKSTPCLGTEQQLLEWGKRIITAEENRIRRGGCGIYNPSISVVKAKLSQFKDCYAKCENLLPVISARMEKLNEMRTQADSLIIQLWNDIENAYKGLDPKKKYDAATKYGIIYETK